MGQRVFAWSFPCARAPEHGSWHDDTLDTSHRTTEVLCYLSMPGEGPARRWNRFGADPLPGGPSAAPKLGPNEVGAEGTLRPI